MMAQSTPATPSDHVATPLITPAAVLDTEPTHARALYAYNARQTKELSVAKNELLRILNNKDKNWWKMAKEDGSSGYVPANYLKVVENQVPSTPSPVSTTSSIPVANTPITSSTNVTYPDLSESVKQRQLALQSRFDRLLQAVQFRKALLEDAQTFFKLSRDIDDEDEWINDHMPIATTTETGNDVEHVQYLSKSFNGFYKDLASHSAKVKQINNDGESLISEGHSRSSNIRDLLVKLQEKLTSLTAAAEDRRNRLAAALELETFRRDADEAGAWISDKLSVLPDDLGRDVSSVQQLQRQHSGFEADLEALQDKLNEIKAAVKELGDDHPEKAASLLEMQNSVMARWRELSARANERRERLEQAYQLQQFKSDKQDAIAWINGVKAEILALPLADDVGVAESALERMNLYRGEILARDPTFSAIANFGEQLIAGHNYASEEIASRIEELSAAKQELHITCERRRKELHECLLFRRFERDVNALQAWMDIQDRFLADTDTGSSVGDVLNLQKRQDEFAVQLTGGGSRVESAKKLAMEMIKDSHTRAQEISNMRDTVQRRYDSLLSHSDERKIVLDDAKLYQEFIREYDNLENFISAAMVKSTDNAHKDPTNLQGKLQTHEILLADLMANNAPVDALLSDGEQMISRRHFAYKDIEQRCQQIKKSWGDLRVAADSKSRRLREAKEEQDYNRGVTDANDWCAGVEQALQSTELGRDLTSARNLLKKHQTLAGDYAAYGVIMQSLDKFSHNLIDSGNFRAMEIRQAQESLNARYKALAEPIAKHSKNLDDSVNLQQFYRLAAEETDWIRERQPTADATELGSDLGGVLSQQASHTRFSLEITAREPLIKAVEDMGSQLQTQGHYASADIKRTQGDVRNLYNRLVSATTRRQHQLEDAVRSEQLLVDIQHVESTISDKLIMASNNEYGRDEDATRILIPKHTVVHSDVVSHATIVADLEKRAQALQAANHFDSERTMLAAAALIQHQEALRVASSHRQAMLEERLELHELRREINESQHWLSDKITLWSATDIGKDQDDCEALLKKCEDLSKDVAVNEGERVTKLVKRGDYLRERKHSDSAIIEGMTLALQKEWNRLQELIKARLQQLSGAFEVHKFNRNSDKMHTELHDQLLIASMGDVGWDVASAEASVRKHESFILGLAPLRSDVDQLVAEGDRLIALHPLQTQNIQARQESLRSNWTQVLAASERRKKQLADALDLQTFLRTFRFVSSWTKEMRDKLKALTLAKDAKGAQTLLEIHAGYKADIDAHQKMYEDFQTRGDELFAQKHFASDEIKSNCGDIRGQHQALLDLWAKLNEIFIHSHEMLLLEEEAAAAAAWLEMHHGRLGNNDSDENDVAGEEARHSDLVTSLAGKENKLNSLKRLTEVRFMEEGLKSR